MKVVKKKADDGFVILDATASSQEVSNALNQASQVFCRQMGLRPEQGKTPAQVASEKLGIKNLDEAVGPQAVELLVPHAINKAGVIPAFMPTAEPKSRIGRGHAFQFELKVLPKPSFELSSYEPVKITIEPFKSDEEQIDRQISDIARQFTEFVAADAHPLEAHDSCLLKMRTTKGGEEVAGLTMEQRPYTLGMDLMPVGFDDHLVGMEVGETREFTFEGPGLDADMNEVMEEYETTITLLEVQKEVVPVINDEWVAKNLPMYKNLADMRERIGADIDKERRKYYEDYKRNTAATELSKRFKGTIRDEIYEGSMAETRANMRQQVTRSGMKWEDFVEQNGGEQQVGMMLMVEMRQNLVLGFALDAYYRHEGLVYNEDDLNEVCFQMNPQNPRGARESMERNGFGYALRESAERLRACKHLVEHADITESEKVSGGGPIFVK